MKNFRKAELTKSFVLFLLLFFVSSFASTVFAQSSSINRKADISIDVELGEGNYTAGGEVKGTVTFSNNDNHSVSNLRATYTLSLLPEGINENQFSSADLKTFDIVFESDTFSLRGKESIDFSLDYSIPEHLPTGNYLLDIGLIRDNASDENSKLVRLGLIEGTDGFVDILGVVMVAMDGTEYPGLAGISFEPDFIPVCRINLKNDTSEQVTLLPETISYLRFIGGEVLDRARLQSFSLSPGEERTMDVELSVIEEPQSYVSTVQFISSSNSLSPIVACRFIVRGDSASVALFEFDKNTYETGDTANAHVLVTGSADLAAAEGNHDASGLGDIELSIVVTDVDSGKVIGEVRKEVSVLSVLETDLEIPIASKTKHYKALLTVSKDGKILTSQEIENQPVVGDFNTKVLIYALIVLVFISAGVYFLRPFMKDGEIVSNEKVNSNEGDSNDTNHV